MTNPLDSIAQKFTSFDLPKHTLALGIIGSESHGTKIPPTDADGIDDTDYMGIVLPPERHVLGLGDWQHWVYGPDDDGLDVTLYSLRKFVGLLLKNNPNVMGFLWMRDASYVHKTEALELLIAERDAFSSLNAYPAFIGYAHAQIKKMNANVFNGYMGAKRKAIVEKFGYDTKNASHLIRLLRQGIEFLETGRVNVFRTADADELMDIKRGRWPLAKVKYVSDALFELALVARQKSALPKDPDYDRIEKLLITLTRKGLVL